jgi:hypothetical protein
MTEEGCRRGCEGLPERYDAEPRSRSDESPCIAAAAPLRWTYERSMNDYFKGIERPRRGARVNTSPHFFDGGNPTLAKSRL